ncbi:MAG: hypothetical protein WC637_14845, partial [Victivallales bacterium]
MNRQKVRASILLCVLGLFIGVEVTARETLPAPALAADSFSAKVTAAGTRIPYDSRYILIQFTSVLDRYSLPGKIDLRDSSNSLLANCTVEMFPGDNSGKTVWIRFSDNFSLEESSKYYVDIHKGLRYFKSASKSKGNTYGTVSKKMTYYFVTGSRCPLGPKADAEGPAPSVPGAQRTKYVV